MRYGITLSLILCLGVTGCATAVDLGTQIDTTVGGELTVGGLEVPEVPELPSPCEDDETAVYVEEGQCVRVTGYHWSPHHVRWWRGCATHKWNGLCDEQLVICVGEGSTVDELGDSCEPCDESEIGSWGEVQ